MTAPLSSKYPDSCLTDVKESEYHLAVLTRSLQIMEEDLDAMDNSDPERTQALKNLMTSKFNFSKDYARLVILKARCGIVGHSWYNAGTEGQS